MEKALSDKVLGCAFKVHNFLGPGLLESAYGGALEIEMRHCGFDVERQVVYTLFYRGEMGGAHVADMLVEKKIILELKSVKELNAKMEAQMLNYLRLSGLSLGYFMNFRNEQVEWKLRVLCR